MKKIMFICFVLQQTISSGQNLFFGKSASCNINVNQFVGNNPLVFQTNGSETLRNATFIFYTKGGFLTGTLINRATTQDNLGYYFVTAGHAFSGEDFDPDFEYSFAFNYQSPTSSNNDVPLSNTNSENLPFQNTSMSNEGGLHYFHKSKLRKVADFGGSIIGPDFVMLEILNPIPPYFNIAFVGWKPSNWFSPIGGSNAVQYTVMHHPKGDIKKVSRAAGTIPVLPIAQTCRLVMKVVDLFFLSWIKKKVSAQVICNGIEAPTVLVPYTSGITEEGSSGAGLSESNKYLVGTLKSGSFIASSTNPCGFSNNINDRFMKFRWVYYNASVKNTLNPNNQWDIDQFGVEPRRIGCHTKLENLGGEYFAAKHYQSDNKIVLRSATSAVLKPNERIRIHPGANYTIYAETFSMGFNTQIDFIRPAANSNEQVGEIRILTSTNPCVDVRSDESNINKEYFDKSQNLRLPDFKPLNINAYLNEQNIEALASEINVYPNPSASGNFTIRFNMSSEQVTNLQFKDLLGRNIYNTNLKCIQGENFHQINLEKYNLQSGVYLVTVQDGDKILSQKVIIGN